MTHQSIEEIRQAALIKTLENAIGQRILILITEFPFIYIGKIVDIVGDYIFVDTETTHISELENRVNRIHITNIDVFYIEDGGPCIPEIC